MARAKRHYVPGLIWHITHRCHKREFLLKFSRDRKRWLHWLYQAKKRFGLCILNYTLTSNHIHLLVKDKRKGCMIPRSMLLMAGRTAQEYNQRKKRRGAFWEDRYHATAVESGGHLFHCMVYIDLNMVRTGVVNHPKEWFYCGYNEILSHRQRYMLIDIKELMKLLDVGTREELWNVYGSWIDKKIESEELTRESKWTESLAVGSKTFVESIDARLEYKARGRKMIEHKGFFELREHRMPYSYDLALKKRSVRGRIRSVI